MGSSASKSEETNEIKAVQEMDEEELSSKDKLFKKAIVEIYEEIKKLKYLNQTKSCIVSQFNFVIGVYFKLIILCQKIILLISYSR